MSAASEIPKIIDNPLYILLREGKIDEFNARREAGEKVDLRGCDFRSVDLQGMNAGGLDLLDCYFRQSDLRGIDFRDCNMQGVSINGARISGVYFPAELSAAEINLSHQLGTRMRYSK